MTNKVRGKPYSKGIKEELAPYLVAAIDTPLDKTSYKYIFNISCAPTYIINEFKTLTKNLKCWKQLTRYRIAWLTDSEFLKGMFKEGVIKDIQHSKVSGASSTDTIKCTRDFRTNEFNCQIVHDQASGVEPVFKKPWEEPVEDIPIEGATAIGNTIWKSNPYDDTMDAMRYIDKEILGEFNIKGNKMNTNKFSVKYKIEIQVNGKDWILTDPVEADAALEVVLELTKRVNFLTDQLAELDSLTDNNDGKDAISTNKIGETLKNEIDEIKEQINFINENIEDAS